ncbi:MULTISPECIES: universal stress protein [Actibacterium]|uniref:Nucleotide-binding universal stress UspA family protein n=1 Tax=Actibacterium naphthalenivorans TaxID=1614693 RepID=A0A840CBE2_9RHOB|nr:MULTISPECIES: universal stress protein [Actibacterium]ALG90455.1 universal stress protein [Actibacterium sp. EMB200-NS6]MBB4022410.1 nucleotide-binding universal stress UspA family protein [Actibacterium naphthalenivorans]
MYHHIIVPIALDHGPNTATALQIARALLADDGKITALHVIEAVPSYVAQYLPEGQEEKTRDAVQTALVAELGGVIDVKPAVVTGHAGRTIVEYAQEHGVDCIVIASHRPGLQDYFLGSTAARVVRHATCAVHVVR